MSCTFINFMSLSPKFRAFKKSKSKNCSPRLRPKMSANTGNTIDATATRGIEKIDGRTNQISPELNQTRIRTNLEPTNEQYSTLTQLLNQLIQQNLTKTNPTAGPRTHCQQAGHSIIMEAGTSSTMSDKIIGCTGSSLAQHPEIIGAEQRCFRDLTFFSAESENMKNISAVRCCFRTDQLWFSPNQGCSELKISALSHRNSTLN